MKWLLAGAGLVMIVFGGSCILSGYPIIEVERGWALVIAGSTGLSGGVIVLGLALVTARLEDVSLALGWAMRPQDPDRAAGAQAAPVEPERSLQAPGEAEIATGGGAEHPASVASPAPRRGRDWRPPAVFRRERSPDEPAPPDLDETVAALAAPARAPSPIIEPAEPEAPAPAEPEHAATPPASPIESEPRPEPPPEPAPEPEPEPRFRRFPLRSLTLPRGPWPDPPAAQGSAASADAHTIADSPAAEPDGEDWFDRALAEIDPPLHADPAGEEPAPPAPWPADDAPLAQVEPPSAGEQPSEAAPEPPAVIGRYEAEGTTYVMYADGSIDAQTAGGVFRFESLAALKAHIEHPA